MAAIQTKNIRDSDAFDFDRFPYLKAHRASLKLDGGMPLMTQVVEYFPRTGRSYGDLLEETFVRLKRPG
jgi:hypothetical protein